MIAKRAFDIVLSAVGLVVLSPLLLGIAALVKLEDGGAVFYRGRRIGCGGRPFRMFKFRSMAVNAEQLGGPSTADRDPRITRIGARLRKYKLDELPQLISVLIGDMSLVGPRPEVEQYVDLMTPEERLILTVRPGITDWATLWNSDEGAVLAGAADPEAAYVTLIRPEKIRLQLAYVRNRSFWTDVTIVARTLAGIVLRTKPAALELRAARGTGERA